MWKTHLMVHLNMHLITSVCFKKQKKGWPGEMMPNYCPSVDDRDLISAFSVWIIVLEVRLLNNCSFLHFPALPLQLHIKVPCMCGSVCVIPVPFHWSVCLSCLDYFSFIMGLLIIILFLQKCPGYFWACVFLHALYKKLICVRVLWKILLEYWQELYWYCRWIWLEFLQY